MKKFSLILGAACILCFGCGNKEVSVEAMENVQTAESMAEAEEDFLSDEKMVTNGKLIVIDAGHQAKADTSKEPIGLGATEMKIKVSGGTSGVSTGLPEYELNLSVALDRKSVV